MRRMRFPAQASVVVLHLATFVLVVGIAETVLGSPAPAKSASASGNESPPVSAPSVAASSASAGPASSAPVKMKQPLDPKRSSDERRALELHDEARQLYVVGHYRLAIEKLDQALQLDPDEKDLHYIMAFVAEKLGDLDLALQHYRACLRLESDEGELMRLGIIIDRVEGAQQHAGVRSVPIEPSASNAPIAIDQPGEPQVDFGPWPYVSASVAGASLLVGTIMGVHALALDPGSDVRTDGATSVQQLQDDASAAHTSAIAADVALSVAGVTGALALVLIIVEQVCRVDQLEGERATPVVAISSGGLWGVRF